MSRLIPNGEKLTDSERRELRAIFEAQKAATLHLERDLPFGLALYEEAREELLLFWERVRGSRAPCPPSSPSAP